MKISHEDRRRLQRFLDGQSTVAESAGLRARLGEEPDLRQVFEEEQRLRAGFAAARTAGPVAPAGFTAGVMAAVRQLPSRRELEEREVGESVKQLCRRLLVAALIVMGLGFVWHSGLLECRRGETLEAAPDEIRREMDRLDQVIQSGALGGSEGTAETGRHAPK